VIARLSGTVLELRTDRLVLDVHGVGYELAIPLGTFSALPPAGEKASVHVHMHVREDALQLFGFATTQEKYVFERLISVSGVGPKVALTVLSGLPLPDLVRAIATQNARVLATIPGIGKKLAERIIFELKEKVSAAGIAAGTSAAMSTASEGEVVAALQALGYSLGEAREASRLAVTDAAAGAGLEERVKAALRTLLRP